MYWTYTIILYTSINSKHSKSYLLAYISKKQGVKSQKDDFGVPSLYAWACTKGAMLVLERFVSLGSALSDHKCNQYLPETADAFLLGH